MKDTVMRDTVYQSTTIRHTHTAPVRQGSVSQTAGSLRPGCDVVYVHGHEVQAAVLLLVSRAPMYHMEGPLLHGSFSCMALTPQLRGVITRFDAGPPHSSRYLPHTMQTIR